MDWLIRLRQRRALTSYLKMAVVLVKAYGPQEQYSAGQLLTQALRYKLRTRWLSYYFALYRHETDPQLVESWQLNQHSLSLLRQELAESLFQGKNAFTALDVYRLNNCTSWHGGTDRKVQTPGATFRQY
ncbi:MULTISPECIES: DUF6559 family protein [Aeromonas]|uniref:DUF6559 family protein n=1 Tax=Aeromonas TaxID=642 RepID=UPI0012F0E0E2|nr:DUF6559 family protein [Aeromonas salmonicida]VXA77085.1 conserved hypothetical protein [Aeromonas salmonicida]